MFKNQSINTLEYVQTYSEFWTVLLAAVLLSTAIALVMEATVSVVPAATTTAGSFGSKLLSPTLDSWLSASLVVLHKQNQPTVRRQGVFLILFFWFFTPVPYRPHNLCKLSLFFSQRKCVFSLSRPRFLYPKSAFKIEGPSKGLPCISSADHTLVTVPPCPLLPLRQNGP